jgi:hypothetical protein
VALRVNIVQRARQPELEGLDAVEQRFT